MKTLTIIACLLFGTVMAQEKKPSNPVKPEALLLNISEVKAIVSKIDTVGFFVVRSDMKNPERNTSVDILRSIANYLVGKYNEQNPPAVAQDSVKKSK